MCLIFVANVQKTLLKLIYVHIPASLQLRIFRFENLYLIGFLYSYILAQQYPQAA